MNQCSLGIDGLSPSARPFPMGSPSSSFSITASKSEHEESIWGDYNLDLSFLSSDDQRSALDTDDSLSNLSRDAETTKEGRILEDAIVLSNPNSVSSKLPELLIESSKDAGDDSEEDTPCWIGILSRKNLSPGAKSVVISRRSTDDLSGFHQLNPLAPQFIPSSSKKNLDTDGGKCEENSSSSLKKSSSSNFPSSSGEFSITDQDDAAARSGGVLTPNADGFVSQDIVSKTVSVSDSRNEFQPSKRLDPLAPVFVPSSAKPSLCLHEKQGAFEANANSISALTYSDTKSLDKVKVDTRSGEVGRSEKIQNSDRARESGSTSSYNAKLSGSSNKPHGQRRLNPLAPQFSLADTKQKAYRNENSAGLSSSLTGYPNMSPGSSSLISLKADSNFGSAKWFSVEPKTKNDTGFKHPLPFHVVETAASSSSSGVKALSGSSPKMDVKKLLTTMHGLSELLTLAHGSDSFNANADEVDLVNSTVENLNLYIQNSIQEQAGNQSVARNNSYDIQLLPNKSNKLSIRDLQLPRANNMTVDLDVKRKEKYSETVPDSRLYQYGVTNDNGFGQVVAQSGYQYQQNHYQGEEQFNQHALFYKSLWLKAEADRCLMVYETSLS